MLLQAFGHDTTFRDDCISILFFMVKLSIRCQTSGDVFSRTTLTEDNKFNNRQRTERCLLQVHESVLTDNCHGNNSAIWRRRQNVCYLDQFSGKRLLSVIFIELLTRFRWPHGRGSSSNRWNVDDRVAWFAKRHLWRHRTGRPLHWWQQIDRKRKYDRRVLFGRNLRKRLEIAKLKGVGRLVDDVCRLFERVRGFLLTLSSNDLEKDHTGWCISMVKLVEHLKRHFTVGDVEMMRCHNTVPEEKRVGLYLSLHSVFNGEM